jgi:hypothetical protein
MGCLLVESMQATFSDSRFSGDASRWNLSRVNNTSEMFAH